MARPHYPEPARTHPTAGWSSYAARRPRSAYAPSSSSALLWPWMTSAPPPVDGTVIGTLASGAAFRYDAHDWYHAGYTNAMNAVVLGATGSGKSNTAAAIALRSLARPGRKVIVVDGKKDWARLADLYGGTVVRFDTSSAINLLEVPEGTAPNDARDVRLRAVRALVALAAGRDLADAELWALEEAVARLQGTAPLMRDLAQLVLHPDPCAQALGGADALQRAGASLLPALNRITSGRTALAELLDRPSTVTFDRDAALFVVSLGDLTLADDLRNAALIAVAAWVDAAVVGNTEPRTLVLDEAWQFLKEPQAALAHAERLRLARANNLANLLVVHKPQDFAAFGAAGSPHRAAVESIFGFSDAVIAGRLDHHDAGLLAGMLNLNSKEPRLITEHPTGRFLWSVQTTATGRRSWLVQTARTPWEARAWHTKTDPGISPGI